MSSVDDIMAVLLEAPSTNNTSTTTNSTTSTPKSTSSKPGRGRPATRSVNKQISSSITITSKPTNTKTQRASSAQQKELGNKETKVVEETKQVGKTDDKVNKQMENKMAKESKTTGKKQQLQEIGAWHTSRLELEFVRV